MMNRFSVGAAAVISSAVLAIIIFATLRFGGQFSGTILGIIGSVLTPALGALFTLLVVTPVRVMLKQAEAVKVETGLIKQVVVKTDIKLENIENQVSLLRTQLAGSRIINIRVIRMMENLNTLLEGGKESKKVSADE